MEIISPIISAVIVTIFFILFVVEKIKSYFQKIKISELEEILVKSDEDSIAMMAIIKKLTQNRIKSMLEIQSITRSIEDGNGAEEIPQN